MAGVFRFLVALALIPFCAALTQVAFDLIVQVQPGSNWLIPPSALATAGGYLLWLGIFFTMPRPVRTYVLAHELTHALWAALMGARVSKLRITKSGGSVNVSKSNFLITLAPYFFPLYTVLVLVLYGVLDLFFPVSRYELIWLALVGFTWGFHFTFTVTTMLQQQSDIEEYGHVFSYVIIYLFNIAGVCLWVLLVAAPTFESFATELVGRAGHHYGALICMAQDAVAAYQRP
ncbi:MAG: hypothetical protein O3C57_01640 [Verrucomicrobia bacterium]|nr:hypothetical protein [Verrucomicrobiota bacterium]